MAKRKADDDIDKPPSKRLSSSKSVKQHFRTDLFDAETLNSYKSAYANAQPYKHGVIQSLIEPSLLRAVRNEILSSISFTPKETDIYKIHQSGDLANLDGLDDEALERLPSLVKLRDAMYSQEFRDYLSDVTSAGKLSGRKTDMAVNVYTPGCHLLCHDDVIGSRRVSYILYLMDPDKGWKADWGGALRLYPTCERRTKAGEAVAVPAPDHSISIPPAFAQLSFFAVQPGLSYHDVEEVYVRKEGEEQHDDDDDDDGGRVRMAISGWYHIPQEGEEGYEAEAEEVQANNSSLAQLRGMSNEFDEPKTRWLEPHPIPDDTADSQQAEEQTSDLTEADLAFLLRYINPRYLIPSTVMSLRSSFEDDSCLRLALFLSPKFASSLHEFISSADTETPTTTDPDQGRYWHTARPPHKHRYLYRYPSVSKNDDNEFERLSNELLPSLPFRKWLALATGLDLSQCAVLARRFRRGKDYQLATSYNDENPQLEACLGITPTKRWGGADENAEDDKNGEDSEGSGSGAKDPSTNGMSQPNAEDAEAEAEKETETDADVGGYEAYMAADDSLPSHSISTSGTGAGQRRSTKADPAIYQSAPEADEDDEGVLFTQPASWNTLTVVLRDQGTMRFVKYVSNAARGDRWDIVGTWGVVGSLDGDSDEGEERGEEEAETEVDDDEEEESKSDTTSSSE